MLFFKGYECVGLDFETYSAVSLPDHGLERYCSDKTFEVLIASKARFTRSGDIVIQRLDVEDMDQSEMTAQLKLWLVDKIIVAHNAAFERRVLLELGIDVPADRFIDSAVLARMLGAAGKLEAAAPQLLGVDKLDAGSRLIRRFCIPGKYQEETPYFDKRIISDDIGEWYIFGEYCDLDAELGLRLAQYAFDVLRHSLIEEEMKSQAVTLEMNATGWHVDVATVEEMQRRYLENVAAAEANFREDHDAAELNLNSLKQLKEWCAERGIRATSFDEKNVAKLKARIEKKLDKVDSGQVQLKGDKYEQYCAVLDLLETKQILGGSSLKKLQVVLNTVSEEGRLCDQYLHVGAPQTWRTTGRSVQMQNLKRLHEPANMVELQDDDCEWDNDKLAANIRQVFTSAHPQGALIVGDFASVESRGLAWLARADWKLSNYRAGMDMYKVLAADMFSTQYDAVTKDQRQAGKVGELSCGYQAGAGAVQSFAAGMGIEMTEGEASKLVTDWRSVNPEIVRFWAMLDEMLHEIMAGTVSTSRQVGYGDYTLVLSAFDTPESLLKQHPGAQSIKVELCDRYGIAVMARFFHGCYYRGRSIGYYKPSERKTGDLWSNHYTNPKTKQLEWRTIYGGKLAGILTQSWCREIFMSVLKQVAKDVDEVDNLELIGQFHDEIVLDWTPRGMISLESAKSALELRMSNRHLVPDFPLVGEIKHDYRYTK